MAKIKQPTKSEPVEFVPPPAEANAPDHWIVLEDRSVCVNGAMTKVRQNKRVVDPVLAQQLMDQGVKMLARTSQKEANRA